VSQLLAAGAHVRRSVLQRRALRMWRGACGATTSKVQAGDDMVALEESTWADEMGDELELSEGSDGSQAGRLLAQLLARGDHTESEPADSDDDERYGGYSSQDDPAPEKDAALHWDGPLAAPHASPRHEAPTPPPPPLPPPQSSASISQQPVSLFPQPAAGSGNVDAVLAKYASGWGGTLANQLRQMAKGVDSRPVVL
jgi:hypothetical protein